MKKFIKLRSSPFFVRAFSFSAPRRETDQSVNDHKQDKGECRESRAVEEDLPYPRDLHPSVVKDGGDLLFVGTDEIHIDVLFGMNGVGQHIISRHEDHRAEKDQYPRSKATHIDPLALVHRDKDTAGDLQAVVQ